MTDAPGPQDEASVFRCRMVEQQIRSRGVRDPGVLEVMSTVPREQFLPRASLDVAYADRALPTDCGQTISQPFIVAYMTEQLSVESDSRVLEIGTGTGYQTAILASLGQHVYTIERFADLQNAAEERLAKLAVSNVTYHVGDGSLGLPAHAPFDRIMVTAGAPSVPTPLIDQLVEGGILVAPVGGTREQTIVRIVKGKGRIVETPLIPCRFVRLIGQAGWSNDTSEAS